MIRKNTDSRSPLGMTKKEVVEEFGKGLNSYTDDIWHYKLSKTWWGLKTIMFLEFENNMVSAKYIKHVFKENKRLQEK
ncbi:hypothetical protein [Epilithonimonas hungarica]|uniref:Uncharacterized protein n=1 Tax=Epilithonimonas hungarica TaxID=454006 RepID=A0A1G7TU77_9FLAO|nr:hypothetical protein [Epilithonimonas hungarica]SDG38805.1 hypothetical protein SAMN05421825_3222 [Epilithonimonas hungarica]